jgi:hypothetical protein
MKLLSLLVFVIFQLQISAQTYSLSGTIKDKQTGQLLSYANVRVLGTYFGSASNIMGEYELRLKEGSYQLAASYIGYKTDTISVDLNTNISNIDFNLEPTDITLSEIVVLPGENPALEIIRKAIERKKEREQKISSYEFDAYTKGVIRTVEEIEAGKSSISIGTSSEKEMMVTGVIENESKGFFKKPDSYKEIITARKQTANLPPSINIITGGRVMRNFYDENINLIGSFLPGPLVYNALSYYYFYIEKTLAIDDKTVYQIYMAPKDNSDPGFEGRIFILDETYDLIKIDLQVNKAANPGGIFDSLNVFQQFTSYGESIYMPVDYRLFVTANYLNIVRFGLELNTILYDYKINPDIKEDFFDKAIVTVLPEADKKDSVYWLSAQTIPNTGEESLAYKRIDSLKNIPKTFWDDFSPLSARINFTENFAVSAPIAMYHFNRIEGHAIDFGSFINDAFDKRLNSFLKLSHGFSDKKLKSDFSAAYLFGDYRTYEIKINTYNKLKILFGESEDYNELTATLLALLSKYEFRDYYYSNGFNFELSGEIFPVLRLSAGFINRTDKNAYNRSDFSFFAKNKSYPINPLVYETKVNAITAGFELDFRNYIEDGFFRRRFSPDGSFIVFEGNVLYSDKNLTKSEIDFTKYELKGDARLRTFRNNTLAVKANFIYTDGSLPYQMLYSLPGNINLTARNFSFRTLQLNEIPGDRIVSLNIEHDFGTELFRLLGIPGLKDWNLTLNTFLNSAYAEAGEKTRAILQHQLKSFKNPFYEAGFGIGHILIPLQVEFAWKLNHKDGNNFRVGINTFIY